MSLDKVRKMSKEKSRLKKEHEKHFANGYKHADKCSSEATDTPRDGMNVSKIMQKRDMIAKGSMLKSKE